MTGGRLLVLLLVVVAAALGMPRRAEAFGIPRAPPAFGVERGISEFYCRNGMHVAAPFRLGSTAAIHLGNTNSCIAAYDFRPGSNDYYQLCIPSWVAVTDNGTVLAGEAAMEHAAVSHGTAISGFIRLLYRRLEDGVVQREMELAPYKFSERAGRAAIQMQVGTETERGGHVMEFSPVNLAAFLMSELRHRAEAHLGRELWAAVVTVPRPLNYDGRRSVVTAGRYDGGFDGVKVIDQQIAAAAAYHHHTEQGDGKAILVLRLGGRTSDATIFKFIDGAARFVAARDDLYLGGDDFTARIVDYMAELIKEQHQWDIRQDVAALRRLRVACEHAKKALSDQEETLVQIQLEDTSLVPGDGGGGGTAFSAALTRAKFEELNQDLFDKAMRLVDDVVMKTGSGRPQPRDESRKDMVDEIVLVGGSARIPKLRQLVKDYFHGRGPNTRKGVEPEDAIIQGTAILSRPEAARYVEECFEHMHWLH